MDSSPGFSDYFYSAPDGLKLHARIYGENVRERWPVVCLPGLTRNARDFHELAMLLSHDRKRPRKVVAFDYRGRGQSAYDPNWKNYDIVVEAEDIVAGLTALGIDHAAFIGTSRGGLIIHVLVAMRPSLLKAVVLNDIGPVVESGGRAHIRAYLERPYQPKSFAEAQALQQAAHAKNFPALTDEDWARFVHALYREENGVPVLDFDPALLNLCDRRISTSLCLPFGRNSKDCRQFPCWRYAGEIRACFRWRRSRKWADAIPTARRSRSKVRAMRRCSKPVTCLEQSRRLLSVPKGGSAFSLQAPKLADDVRVETSVSG